MTREPPLPKDEVRPLILQIRLEMMRWAPSRCSPGFLKGTYQKVMKAEGLKRGLEFYNPAFQKTWDYFFGFYENAAKQLSLDRKVPDNIQPSSLNCIRTTLKELGIIIEHPPYGNYKEDPESWSVFLAFCLKAVEIARDGGEPPKWSAHNQTAKISTVSDKGGTPVSPAEGDTSQSVEPPDNIPPVNEYFMGREKLADDIRSYLFDSGTRVAVTALYGLRGVGKSTLAAAYARDHQHEYRVRWWIRAETEDGARNDLIALGVRLGWVRRGDPDEEAFDAVMKRLSSADKRTLLIYDNALNARDLKRFLPPTGDAHVIITSNAQVWDGVAKEIPIDVWPEDVGAAYLISRLAFTGKRARAERASAEALSRLLGGLPLALEQAAAYCKRCRADFAEYQRLFIDETAEFLDDREHIAGDYHEKEAENFRTVAGTFSLVIKKAAETAGAEPLIVYASLLAADSIPKFLFEKGSSEFGEVSPLFRGRKLGLAIGALLDYSLIYVDEIPDERDSTVLTKSIRLHRLVREIASRRRSIEERDAMRRQLLAAMVKIFPKETYTDRRGWPIVRRLSSHASELMREDASYLDGQERLVIRLLDLRAGYLHGPVGDTAGALKLYERAMDLCETLPNRDDPLIGTILHGLAWVKASMRDHQGAKDLFLQARAIRDKALPMDDPDRIETIHRIGWIMIYLGEYEEAEEIVKTACAMFEDSPVRDAPVISTPYASWGWVCMLQGRYSDGIAHYEHEREMLRKRYKVDHSVLAWSAQNIGLMYLYTDQYDKARDELKRALFIRVQEYGRQHPETAMALQNFSMLWIAKGDIRRADLYIRSAIRILKAVHSENHPRFARCLATLAEVCLAQGNISEATALAEKVDSIRKEFHAPGHPDRANTELLFARIELARGIGEQSRERLETAKTLAQSAVTTLEQKLTEHHIWVRTARAVLAEIEAQSV